MEVTTLLSLVRAKRFSRSTIYSYSFNDPRITDFAYVNTYILWQIAKVLKATGVLTVNTTVDYDASRFLITSPDHTFIYSIPLMEVA